jgi:hypothetical protein
MNKTISLDLKNILVCSIVRVIVQMLAIMILI